MLTCHPSVECVPLMIMMHDCMMGLMAACNGYNTAPAREMMPLWDWLRGVVQQNLGRQRIPWKNPGRQKSCSPAFFSLCSWPLCWHRRSRRQKSCLVLTERSTCWTMCSIAPSERSSAHIATRFPELSQRTHVSTMVIKHSTASLPTSSYFLYMIYIFGYFFFHKSIYLASDNDDDDDGDDECWWWWCIFCDEIYSVMKVILWWKLTSDESYNRRRFTCGDVLCQSTAVRDYESPKKASGQQHVLHCMTFHSIP